MKPRIYSILAALVLTGCVGGVSPKLSESHPANPRAHASPVAPATPMLVAGSQGLVLPVSTNEAGMQHEHHQKATPAKPAQKPTEHQHDHEQPKKEEKK
jgi:hypothetical protein